LTPVTLTLLGAPEGKGRPRFGKGFTYTPVKTRSYEAMLRHEAALAMRGRQFLEGALQLVVTAYMPIPASWSRKRQHMAAAGDIMPTSRPDADNRLKPLDALNAVCWRDDAQIVSLTFTKRYSVKPSLVVTISQAVPCDIEKAAA
jgi:Holliday junction resolvase RusA-like endonuclease